MNKLFATDKVYVGRSRIPGVEAERGVFAKRNIKKNVIIETCPIIEVSKHDTASLNESMLVTYFFYFGRNKERLAIALGFGSLYNHTYKPNAKYKINLKKNTIDFTALRNIKKDDEITFNYNNGNSKDKIPLWIEGSV